jgi:hypothetical protein
VAAKKNPQPKKKKAQPQVRSKNRKAANTKRLIYYKIKKENKE